MGGSGGSIAYNTEELVVICESAGLELSRRPKSWSSMSRQ
ncbi:hypothetical protein ACLK12_00175 [Escherichia coli]